MRWQVTSVNLLAAIALAAPFPVAAQAPVTPSPRPELHRQFLLMALDSYQRARCEGNQPCAPASAAERATPPITDDQARAIVAAATISTMAEHCQLDWGRRNFVPLMQHHRERLKMNERQMALVGLLHGITMGAVGETVRRTPCTPEMKASTEKRLLAP
jgi:hypothetical protein